MTQINFRVDDSIKLIVDILSKDTGKSIAQIAKESFLKDIESFRVDLAFNLLEKGKIGRKKAWKISGLEYSDFLKVWREKGAEENILKENIDRDINLIDELLLNDSYKKYIKK